MTTRPTEYVEREVKLAAGPNFELPDLAGVLAGCEIGAPVLSELEAVYFDTADVRLIRAGITVRHRRDASRDASHDANHDASRAEWTVKLPEGAATGPALLRREHTVRAGPGRSQTDDGAGPVGTEPLGPGPAGGEPLGPVPASLDALVRAVARTAALLPVARLRTTRRRRALRGPGGQAWGELDDDEVIVDIPGAPPEGTADRHESHFREIEVELTESAPPELLDALVARLRAAGAGAHDPSPKLARALGPRASAPPELGPPVLHDGASAAEVVGAALIASVARIIEHDRVIRVDADPEGVHQARVGARRLRSDLRTFGPLLDRSWSEPLRDELRWIAAELGTARDADVLAARVQRQIDGLGVEDRVAAAPLLDALRHQRAEAHRALAAALEDRRYLELLDRLVDGANEPRLTIEAAAPAVDVLPRLVSSPWRKLRRAVDDLDEGPTDDQLHQVRIRAKRARYAADVARPVAAKSAAKLARSLSELQDVLGEVHDAAVTETWLRNASRSSTPAAALAAGLLVAGQRADAAQSRDLWPAAWRSARAKKRTGWLT